MKLLSAKIFLSAALLSANVGGAAEDAPPVFIPAADSAAAEASGASRVNLPPVAQPGEYPRLLFTRSELAEFKQALALTKRGREARNLLLKLAENYLKSTPEFPDPKGPGAQLKSRSDPLAQQHNNLSKRAGALGMAYALTGEEKYARGAAEVLLGYAQRYESYPEHGGANASDTSKVMAQRLSEAMWLIPQLTAFDFIHDSAALSDADRRLIETGLIRPAIAMIRRADPAQEAAQRDRGKEKDWRTATPPVPAKAKALGNWLNFYATATMMAGSVLDDRAMLDLATADFRVLLTDGIGPDGLWGEGAISYQMFAMGAMAPGFEAAARRGIDLWSFAERRFKQLFDTPLRYAYPDGTLPGINDSGRARFGSWQTMVYDYAYLRYGDARYLPLIEISPRQLFPTDAVYLPTRIYSAPGKATPAPPTGSTLFSSQGYAILRQAQNYALLDYGPHGGVHGHFDKLNLLLFVSETGKPGDEVGGEPVFHRYENPLHAEWTKQSIAHNTLTVDEKSQAAGEGKLRLFADTPEVKIMRAESTGSYPGVTLDRTVVLMDELVLDLFRGASATNHTWDRTFRYNGKLNSARRGGGEVKALGNRDGYQHVQAFSPTSATEGWRGSWATPAGDFEVRLAGVPQQQVLEAKGPDGEELAIARQTGTHADFAAVYQLKAWPKAASECRWLTTPGDDSVGASVFEVARQDGEKIMVAVAHTPGAWTAAGWTSDARVLHVRQRGSERQVVIGGGTFAREGAWEVRRPEAGIYVALREDYGGAVEVGGGERDQLVPIVAVTDRSHQGNFGPASVLDGDFETRWTSEGNEQWLDLDLGRVRAIASVEIAFMQGDKRNALFVLQTSVDGQDWQTVFEGQSAGKSTGFERFAFSTRKARFVRYLGFGNSDNPWNSLAEVKINAGSSPVTR